MTNAMPQYLREGAHPKTLCSTRPKWPFDCLSAKRDQKRICCWCGVDLPKGRQSWCGKGCVDDYQMKYDWGKIRAAVERRDRGVCVLCGLDTEKLKRVLRHARSAQNRMPMQDHAAWSTVPKIAADRCREHAKSSAWREAAVEIGFSISISRDWWEADHIVPRVRGGGNELTNLRTLCWPCHVVETANLAAERARERRELKSQIGVLPFGAPVHRNPPLGQF